MTNQRSISNTLRVAITVLNSREDRKFEIHMAPNSGTWCTRHNAINTIMLNKNYCCPWYLQELYMFIAKWQPIHKPVRARGSRYLLCISSYIPRTNLILLYNKCGVCDNMESIIVYHTILWIRFHTEPAKY
jgi:hypothetical protein